MPTTDYTALTPEQWEDLGRRIREAQAEVNSPVVAEAIAGLQGHSARELREWRDALVARRAGIHQEAARRSAYVTAALDQIDAVLRG